MTEPLSFRILCERLTREKMKSKILRRALRKISDLDRYDLWPREGGAIAIAEEALKEERKQK